MENRRFACQGELICGVELLPEFYARHEYSPVWGLEQGQMRAARNMLESIRDSAHQGMNPSDYHLGILERLLTSIQEQLPKLDARKAADADILLTDAFLTLAGHLRAGRVNPETLHPSWMAHAHAPDLVGALHRALQTTSVQKELREQLPPHAGYHRLRRAWEEYARLVQSGGWTSVPSGENLSQGDISERIPALGQRLHATHDLAQAENATVGLEFTSRIHKAVCRFQARHELRVDGVVGPKTLDALNVSARQRTRQLALNMERWRWIPRDLGTPHVRVNVADFSLVYSEGPGREMRQRVIVGKTARRTPVFSDQISHIVLNPVWNVPRSIMIEDILPKVKQDPKYLQEHSMTLLSGWGGKAEEIDPSTIDWESVDPESFPYRIRQEPGPDNALGRIKFIFPNPFAVYLHDTPNKYLFNKVSRDFSSGCIRVEHPLRLALALLQSEQGWSMQSLRRAIQSGETQTIHLSRPVPVHLLYWTAWVDDEGRTHFRKDIYSRDQKLEAAFSRTLWAESGPAPES